MMKMTFAMPADACATPVNPKTPAIMAITKNASAHPNIMRFLSFWVRFRRTTFLCCFDYPGIATAEIKVHTGRLLHFDT